MPFSHSGQISTIIGAIEHLNPASVLDVGTGMGQYGFLLRNNLELAALFEVDGAQARQRRKDEWRVRIDGIEGYAGYLTPVHDYAYNSLRIGNALDLLPQIASDSYDLVMAIDILEHFDKAQGLQFLGQCRRIARRMALISTPKDFCAQHVEANPFEDHRSHWTQADLQAAGYARTLPDAASWVVVADKG